VANKPKIVAFAGSTRKASYNKKLVKAAAKAAEEAGGDVQYVDLAEYPMPLYDGDLEEEKGLPETAIRLREIFIDADGFLMATPEYNSSVTGVWKNTIDWLSRPHEDEPGLVAFRGKTAGLMSASPGALGGLRGLFHVRSILMNIGVLVLPNQHAISQAHDAFDDAGALTGEKHRAKIEEIARDLVETITKLKA